jgi:hypothetical protein
MARHWIRLVESFAPVIPAKAGITGIDLYHRLLRETTFMDSRLHGNGGKRGGNGGKGVAGTPGRQRPKPPPCPHPNPPPQAGEGINSRWVWPAGCIPNLPRTRRRGLNSSCARGFKPLAGAVPPALWGSNPGAAALCRCVAGAVRPALWGSNPFPRVRGKVGMGGKAPK